MSAVIGALALVGAAFVTGLFGLLSTRHTAVVPPRSAATATTSPPDPAQVSPIAFEAFTTRMTTPELTELQRRDFLREHLGRRVEWEGHVRRVRPAASADGEPRYLLGFSPDPESAVVAYCWFGGAWGTDLRGLALGQRVTVSGVLEGWGAAGPTLGTCRLTRI